MQIPASRNLQFSHKTGYDADEPQALGMKNLKTFLY